MYRLNLFNPLVYLWFIISIPLQVIISLFTQETVPEHVIQSIKYLKGERISRPSQLFIKLRMVTKIENR